MNLRECAIHLANTVRPNKEIGDLPFLYLLTETSSAYQIQAEIAPMIDRRAEKYLSVHSDELISSDIAPVFTVDEISPKQVETAVFLYEWINEGENIDQTDYPPYQRFSEENINTIPDVFRRICVNLQNKINGLPGNSNNITSENVSGLTIIIRQYQKRIEYGVRRELLELMGTRGVSRNIGRNIYEQGIESREDLRECNKYSLYKACRGNTELATKILQNVGRTDYEVSISEIKGENKANTDDPDDRESKEGQNIQNGNLDDNETDWDRLRADVYARDDYECQNCGRGGGPKGDTELHAHHIVPKSRGGNNKMSNLTTLCIECHQNIHPHMKETQ